MKKLGIKLVPNGKRSPPLMRLATYPTFEELEMWRQMHQNPFFNRNRIVTEKDVKDGLQYADIKTRITAMPSLYLILKPKKMYEQKTSHENSQFLNTTKQMKHLPTKSNFNDKKRWAVAKEAPFTPVRFKPFPRTPSKTLHFEPVMEPSTSRPLLRRPLAPVWRNTKSLAAESELSLDFDEHGQMDFENWRKCSLTTVFKDDPLDPDNFYNNHYPLLLKQVPKRFKGEGSNDMYDDMYRPASKTPDIDMRYFYVLAHTSLSDEILLPDRAMRVNKSKVQADPQI